MKAGSGVIVGATLFLLGCAGSGPALWWEPTGGPTAQNVSAMLADEKVPGSVLAGLLNGDIYVSSNLGKTWTMLHRAPQRKRIYKLVQHPEESGRFYAASEGGLFVSTNRGMEWTQVRIEPGAQEQTPCYTLAIDPWKPTTLFAGLAGKGLHQSTDGGRTWAPALLGTNARLSLSTVTVVLIDPSRPDVVYVAIDGAGIMRSADAGKSWTSLTSDPGMESPTTLLVHRGDSRSVIFGTASGAFFKSGDGGQNWSQTAVVAGGGRVYTMSEVPDNRDLAYAGTENGVMRSTDFGGSWLDIRSSLPSTSTSVMVVQDQDRPFLFAYGSGIGVQMSADHGNTWAHLDAGLGGADVSLIISSTDGSRIFGAVDGTIFQNDPVRNVWVSATSGLRGRPVTSMCFDEANPGLAYAATPAGMFRTSTGGSSWEPFGRTLPSPPRIVAAHPWYKNRLFAAGDHGIFYSTNSGTSWSQTRPADMRYQVNAFTFTPTNAGLVHAATEDAGVLQSTNGGITWEERRYGLKQDNITQVTLDDDDPRTLYAWTANGECFRSTNLGAEWDRYAVPWQAGAQVLIAMEKGKPNSVVAVVNGREIYHSYSGGGTWRQVLQRGPAFKAATAHWNDATKVVFLGTRDSGVFRIDLGPYFETVTEQDE
jgi:photosystem II stability/assembly factor-like uncharacterized protein